jgi:hypothetical protein
MDLSHGAVSDMTLQKSQEMAGGPNKKALTYATLAHNDAHCVIGIVFRKIDPCSSDGTGTTQLCLWMPELPGKIQARAIKA